MSQTDRAIKQRKYIERMKKDHPERYKKLLARRREVNRQYRERKKNDRDAELRAGISVVDDDQPGPSGLTHRLLLQVIIY